ncbi:MAG: hypothetical protein ACE5HI_06225 [bacterium]
MRLESLFEVERKLTPVIAESAVSFEFVIAQRSLHALRLEILFGSGSAGLG